MGNKKEIVIAREVERLEFIENIRSQINVMTKAIEGIEKQIRTFQDLYLRVSNDEIYYNLKFYIVGDGLTYEKKGRKKIGF